jgi:hypothetical protein
MEKTIKPILRRSSRPEKRKSVRCVETGIVYTSGRDAADILIESKISVSPESINKVCRGHQKTAGGYHWEYADNVAEI